MTAIKKKRIRIKSPVRIIKPSETISTRKAAIRKGNFRSAHNKVREAQPSESQEKNTRDKLKIKPKYDLGKGRLIYPKKDKEGKIQYVPRESTASDVERKKGLYIKDHKPVVKEVLNYLNSKIDIGKGRNIYPVKDKNGTLRYLPRRGEATSYERSEGLYIDDDHVKGNDIVEGLSPRYDVGKGRNVYPSRDNEGKIVYLPGESEATEFEKSRGSFVEDIYGESKKITAKLKPRYDIGKGRTVYPAKDTEGKLVYLPSESYASDLDKRIGAYVTDDDAMAVKNETERRLLRATQKLKFKRALSPSIDIDKKDHVSKQFTMAKDGTKLWDCKSIPEISLQKKRAFLKRLKPKYDLGKGRMIYPTQVGDKEEEIAYLPLKEDATRQEIFNGAYAEILPEQDLWDFIKEKALMREFEVDGGKVNAVAEDELQSSINNETDFVLLSRNLLNDVIRIKTNVVK